MEPLPSSPPSATSFLSPQFLHSMSRTQSQGVTSTSVGKRSRLTPQREGTPRSTPRAALTDNANNTNRQPVRDNTSPTDASSPAATSAAPHPSKRTLDSNAHQPPVSLTKRRKVAAPPSEPASSSPASSIFDVAEREKYGFDDTALTAFSPRAPPGDAASPGKYKARDDLVALASSALVANTFVADPTEDLDEKCVPPAGLSIAFDKQDRLVDKIDSFMGLRGPQVSSRENLSFGGLVATKVGRTREEDMDDDEATTEDGVFYSQPLDNRQGSPTLTVTPGSSPQKVIVTDAVADTQVAELPGDDSQSPGAECAQSVVFGPDSDQDSEDNSSISVIVGDEASRNTCFAVETALAGSDCEGTDDEDNPGNHEDDVTIFIQNSPSKMPVPLDNDVDNETYPIAAILGHRASKVIPHALELKVQWTGYDDPTWEPERSVQAQAPEVVYEYWRALKGGRPGDVYRVFAIVDHWEVRARAPRKKLATISRNTVFRVQWEGYSGDDHDTTVEPASKICRVAPTVAKSYWDHVQDRQGV
ncbi:hypothetical protein NKR23_g7131 [Pleurostoma richardsiae]|uniref:Chromo domain-containing protein n=1 Tax=Pleurostoma richardsiae TaxID=41990 RepID=A0AA38RWQ6_9PEZI|nr:hypothetical protein NKR23_g7131 [Pleurostoma richardsiae]